MVLGSLKDTLPPSALYSALCWVDSLWKNASRTSFVRADWIWLWK